MPRPTRSSSTSSRPSSGLRGAAAAGAGAPAASGTDDLIENLQKLGALRDQGILTDAEFEAQKAKLIAGA